MTALAMNPRLHFGDLCPVFRMMQVLAPRLVEKLCRRFQAVDEQLVYDGVLDAILGHCRDPQRFDAGRGVALDRFLALAACRNVRNLLRSERRRKRREGMVAHGKKKKDVALDPAAGILLQKERDRQERERQAVLDALDDPRDKEIMRLRLEGVRDTEVYARVLGISDLPLQQQKREVKREKDRIWKVLKRKDWRLAL